MKLSIQFLLSLLALSCTSFLSAQDNGTVAYSKFPLKIAFGNHTVGFPYQNSFSAFNPHVSVGTESSLNTNQKHQFFLASNLGLIRNQVIGNTITVDLEVGYRHTGKRGLFVEIALGLGVLDQFYPKSIYRPNTSDGTYEKTKDTGRLSSLLGLKTGIGYDFSKKTSLPFSIGLTHNFFIQTSYFDVMSFPIMPQSTTNISITYKFKKP